MKTAVYAALFVAFSLLTPTPTSSYSYLPYDGEGGGVEEVIEPVLDTVGDSADQYLDGLLDALNAVQSPEVQEEQAADEAEDAQEQYGEYLKDVIESVIDAIYGPVEDPEKDGEEEDVVTGTTTTAPSEEEDDDEQAEASPTTVSPVVTTEADESEEEEEDEKMMTTTVAPSSEDEAEDDEEEDVVTTVAPTATTVDDVDESDDSSDDEDETTTTTTTTIAPAPTTEDGDDDDVVTTMAPASSSEEDDDGEDETTTASAPIDRTLSTIDDDDDDDDETTTTTTTTTTASTTTTTTRATTTMEDNSSEEDDDNDDDTTTAPTPVTTTSVPNLCEDCEFQHGIGYTRHPSDCTLFVQCQLSREGVPVVAGVQSCPHGLYWNQDKLTCDFQKNVQCDDDICDSLKTTKRSGATCRGFWDCSTGQAQAKCCAAGFAYNPVTERCDYDPTCQADCLSPTYSLDRYECHGMRSVPGNRNAYEVKTGQTWTRMKCPPTLGFIDRPCGCNERLENPVPTPQCVPELYMPFDKDASDYSGQNLDVFNSGVEVRHGKAIFNGNSRLRVNFFSNNDWGSIVYIHLRYRLHSLASDARQALVSNGDCQERPSVAVCASRQGVDFYAETTGEDMPANFTVPFAYPKDGEHWKDVLYRLDDGKLSGFVDKQMTMTRAQGALERRQRALVIGSGGGCDDLLGYIDELTVYRCRPHY